MPSAAIRRRRDDLVQQVGRGSTAADVFARASTSLRRLVPFDAAAWLGTDPGTGLPTSPVRIDEPYGITQAMCSDHWQHELLADDVNLFRNLARAEVPAASEHDRPGLLLFDREGEIVSVNEDARLWLAELPAEPALATDHGVDVPVWMLITMFRAGAIRHGAGDGTARTRVRTRRGQWLVCHASCLQQPDGGIGETALVIEPAQPAAIAPIIVEAYDLSEREQQVIRLIARGAGTTEIADELFLSRHTIRDHVKTIFAKADVSSRGELIAKLFAEFYEPMHDADVTRVHGS